jgi:2-polyprenyl-3-methyl-5-hydroxy-6-metoxy-1,4-benzoquinol methylase
LIAKEWVFKLPGFITYMPAGTKKNDQQARSLQPIAFYVVSKICSINFGLNKNWTTGSRMVVAKNATQDWTQFWKGERTSFNEVMKLATTYFARQIVNRFSLTSRHQVFDYGCGPGFFADHLSTLGIPVTGADINPYFIEQSRNNHPRSLFIHTSSNISEAAAQLAKGLNKKRFDVIVMLSISQYFGSLEEFEQVIRMLTPYASQTGRIVVADVLDSKTSSYIDGLGLLMQCIRHAKLISFVRFMRYVTSSTYAKIYKDSKLLQIPEDFVKDMCKRNGLAYEKVSGLTIHPSRTNYILWKLS